MSNEFFGFNRRVHDLHDFQIARGGRVVSGPGCHFLRLAALVRSHLGRSVLLEALACEEKSEHCQRRW